eukprot:CAMPEP_0196132918 /NCGR_PEP_ID=MMETSP0910-20130528/2349_1 /TAXON_ID=49265 /ORGANISM="Thalassiosira rotula, Strain GSO102" /LENGTH=132 /DNA_ID=CAMNT_0041392573 /DNA_START=87 /DNA_END=485 /DNA_ORIENTATION=+
MTAASTPPLHILRGILRLTKSAQPKPVSAAPTAASAATTTLSPASSQPTNNEITLRQHIISQYRESRSLPPHKAKTQRKIAYDYYILKQDLVERGRLHDLDQGADEKLSPKELSRRAAARAGLQLPKLDSDL